jgi:hypothetical protein
VDLLGQLEALLSQAECLYLARLEDVDGCSYIAAVRRGNGSQHVSRASLEDLLAALEPEKCKRCTQCGSVKPLNHFRHRPDGDSQDGRTSQCKVCDRQRLAKFNPRANRAYRRLAPGEDLAP